jgi:uncharacterized protein (DUF1810 family)
MQPTVAAATASMCPETLAGHDGSVNYDSHGIEKRFLKPHRQMFVVALQELENGCKVSCWSWYFLPTPPYIVDGIERGSPMNQKYALRGDDEVNAFLGFSQEGVNLRQNYLAIVTTIRSQLQHGLSLSDLLGPVDASKAISSFQLFERIGMDREDAELYTLCGDVLELCGEVRRPPPPTPTAPASPVKRKQFICRSLLCYFCLKSKK